MAICVVGHTGHSAAVGHAVVAGTVGQGVGFVVVGHTGHVTAADVSQTGHLGVVAWVTVGHVTGA